MGLERTTAAAEEEMEASRRGDSLGFGWIIELRSS